MDKFYVNKNPQPNGDHEVHVYGCYWLTRAKNQHELGYFEDCIVAVEAAKTLYRQSNGCETCCPACHTA